MQAEVTRKYINMLIILERILAPPQAEPQVVLKISPLSLLRF